MAHAQSISCDAGHLLADIALLAQAAERSLQVRQRLVEIGDIGPELICVDVDDSPAVVAGELRIRLYFANPIAELVAAVRAGQLDGSVSAHPYCAGGGLR